MLDPKAGLYLVYGHISGQADSILSNDNLSSSYRANSTTEVLFDEEQCPSFLNEEKKFLSLLKKFSPIGFLYDLVIDNADLHVEALRKELDSNPLKYMNKYEYGEAVANYCKSILSRSE